MNVNFFPPVPYETRTWLWSCWAFLEDKRDLLNPIYHGDCCKKYSLLSGYLDGLQACKAGTIQQSASRCEGLPERDEVMAKNRINLFQKARLIIMQEKDCFKCKRGNCTMSNKVAQRKKHQISTRRHISNKFYLSLKCPSLRCRGRCG